MSPQTNDFPQKSFNQIKKELDDEVADLFGDYNDTYLIKYMQENYYAIKDLEKVEQIRLWEEIIKNVYLDGKYKTKEYKMFTNCLIKLVNDFLIDNKIFRDIVTKFGESYEDDMIE